MTFTGDPTEIPGPTEIPAVAGLALGATEGLAVGDAGERTVPVPGVGPIVPAPGVAGVPACGGRTGPGRGRAELPVFAGVGAGRTAGVGAGRTARPEYRAARFSTSFTYQPEWL